MSIKQVRKWRFMPFIKRGMRVTHTHSGRSGRISGSNGGLNLNITFDGDNHSTNCHPNWMMKYFDGKGNLIKEFGA